jgi:hypothetical protein
MDDLLIHDKTLEDHNHRLETVLKEAIKRDQPEIQQNENQNSSDSCKLQRPQGYERWPAANSRKSEIHIRA